jgi:ubiquinone/menaquinone biosynthesis C-methylase UbiE
MTPPHQHGHPVDDHRRMHEAVWTKEQALEALEFPGRSETEDPDALWKAAGLRRGMTVVDVGAGSGFFALPAARIVGPKGRVFAVDVSRELVELIGERARSDGLRNVEALLSRPGRIPLADRTADRVLLANLLHGVPPETIREAVRLLGRSGRFLALDWKKEPTPGGPPVEFRLTPSEAGRVLGKYGMRTIRSWEAGPYHYAILLKRAEPVRTPRTPVDRVSHRPPERTPRTKRLLPGPRE